MNKKKKDLDEILKSIKSDIKRVQLKKDDVLSDILKKLKNSKK